MFVHGGCYLSRYTISHAAPLEQALADCGYAVWSVEYRRLGNEGGGWPGRFQDVARAADHVRMLAGQYPLDLRRVVVAGHSAGADFALWLAARDRIASGGALRVERPLAVSAVLALAPVADLAAFHSRGLCGNVMDKLMGGSPERVPGRYRDVSLAQMLPLRVPQVLVVGGRIERSARLVEIPESGHFDVIAPTTPAWRIVMEALRDLFAAGRPAGTR